MEYDMEYKVYQYLNEQAAQYVPFSELLRQNRLTFPEAKQQVDAFRERFHRLLEKHHIACSNAVRLCYDLMERIREQPDAPALQYLYFCTITDFGLLNEINSGDRTEAQSIRNYFRQNERIQELSAFLSSQRACSERLNSLRTHLKKAPVPAVSNHSREAELLYQLTLQHTFLCEGAGSEVYRDNLQALLLLLNSDERLWAVKPYGLFAVLTRKHGMMQNRAHFIPNLPAVFQYQAYNICKDNGKNFSSYQSYTELYDHLRRFYLDDAAVDMALCDFCFANLCPFSEWFYRYCEPELEIPVRLPQKILSLKPVSFPMLYCYEDYSSFDLGEFEAAYPVLVQAWEEAVTPELTEEFLQLLYHEADLSACVSRLPQGTEYPRYAELFLYQCAELQLEERMVAVSEQFIKV